MKTKSFILLMLVLIFIIYTNSCKPNYESCTWEKETTNMHIYLREKVDPLSYDMRDGVLNSYDTIKYNMLVIMLNFDLKLISDYTCSNPTDSVIGNIDYLTVVSNHYFNNDTILDTINNIISARIRYFNNEEIIVNLDDLSLLHHRCNANIYLYLNSQIDSTYLQSFTIYYKETDGTTYSATSYPIYVTP